MRLERHRTRRRKVLVVRFQWTSEVLVARWNGGWCRILAKLGSDVPEFILKLIEQLATNHVAKTLDAPIESLKLGTRRVSRIGLPCCVHKQESGAVRDTAALKS